MEHTSELECPLVDGESVMCYDIVANFFPLFNNQ